MGPAGPGSAGSAGRRLRWREILGLVKSRIQRWVGGDLVTLWSEAVEGAQSLSKRSRSAPQRSINIRRAKMATQDGQYSKAIRALTSDGLATPSATVLQEMLTKHPQSASASLPPGPVPPSVSVSESTVRKGVSASHLSACRSVGVEFIPFVMETLGGLAEDSIFILRSLGKAIAQRVGSLDTSTDTSVCTKQLFHRTAIALCRGNAIQWLHRQPILPPSTDGFV